MSAARSDRPLGPNWVQHDDGWWYAPGTAPAPGEGEATPPGAKKPTSSVGSVLAVFVVLGLVVWGCTALTSRTEEERQADGSSLACRHFRNIASDVSEGLLTDAELRSKLQEVRDDSSIATPAVQDASTAMLRAATAGDGIALTNAVNRMGDACRAAGH